MIEGPAVKVTELSPVARVCRLTSAEQEGKRITNREERRSGKMEARRVVYQPPVDDYNKRSSSSDSSRFVLSGPSRQLKALDGSARSLSSQGGS
eukprot:421196-Hanusia_phi.AAC.3